MIMMKMRRWSGDSDRDFEWEDMPNYGEQREFLTDRFGPQNAEDTNEILGKTAIF
jgi:hypothetical protein